MTYINGSFCEVGELGMNIIGVNIKNFKAHKDTGFVPINTLTAFIGKNDSGKSSILAAIKVFLSGKRQIDINDIYDFKNLKDEDYVEIDLMFNNYSENIKNLGILTESHEIHIKKTFDHEGKLINYSVKVHDYVDEDFKTLWAKKEQELNKLESKYNLNFTKSGRVITNEEKINSIRDYADSHNSIKKDYWFSIQGTAKDLLDKELPTFVLFENEVSLDTETASFQKPFQENIAQYMEGVFELSSLMETRVRESIMEIGKKIESYLKEQTDTVESVYLVPEFDWKHIASVRINITDKLGQEVSAEKRGSGLKRLIMVSYLRYMAESSRENGVSNVIYGIEEPETSLHPGAQKVLLDSIKTLAANGIQIIITTHSPVFASDLTSENIIIIKREIPSTKVVLGSDLKREQVCDEIVKELGISSRDAILKYHSCVFVEGKADVTFFETAWNKLAESGRIEKKIDDLHIGFIPYGGDNLKFFVERGVLKSINRNFAVIVDSDKKSQNDQIPQTKIKFSEQCENDGGKFITLKKREIENYIHKDAFERSCGRKISVIDDYEDNKKKLFNGKNGNSNFEKVIKEMTADEFLERDLCENGQHELIAIINSLIEFFNR